MDDLGYFTNRFYFGVVAVNDSEKYINRIEGAKLLGVGIKSLANMEKKGLIPTPAVRIHNDKTGRPNIGYERTAFMTFVKTNPIKHPGYKNAEKRQAHYADKAPSTKNEYVKADVWNIRSKAKNFVYEGKAADIILFCRNNLLNRHKYSNQDSV
jgi:hypothetical protein